MKVTALVFAGQQGQPRYVPGLGMKTAVFVGQQTNRGGRVESLELDGIGLSVICRMTTADGKPLTEWDKTPEQVLLKGDCIGIPIGMGVLVYSDDKPAIKAAVEGSKAK